MPTTYKMSCSRSALFVLLSSLLSGCVFTRVSDDAFAREVNNLHVTGMSLHAAVMEMNRQGYRCSADSARLTKVALDANNARFFKQLECSKQSMEAFCPQIRNVVLNADPDSDKVIRVGKNITQRGYF
ncbi:hypothetical protein QWU01_09110 [Kluyvera cryocrescens]|uniref:Lipoprotein n=1 Tax=Kluyvera cryocrescens TaxID=580 RepID=A0AAW9C5M4_KLUCR|nr:hypothetical protein [Kluyvera cryocrescens]MDW3776967.1 hypothetical protein [Kluyvera cryocrescens]